MRCGATPTPSWAIGTRLMIQQREWGIDAGLPVVRIDAEPREMARFPGTRGGARRRRGAGPEKPHRRARAGEPRPPVARR